MERWERIPPWNSIKYVKQRGASGYFGIKLAGDRRRVSFTWLVNRSWVEATDVKQRGADQRDRARESRSEKDKGSRKRSFPIGQLDTSSRRNSCIFYDASRG